MEEYYYSTNEEEFSYDNLHGAVIDVLGSKGWKVGDIVSVWRGEPSPFRASYFVPTMADQLTERASDEMGEHADGWEFSKQDLETLQDAVEKAVDAWADTRNMHPKFFSVRNVVPIEVRVLDEDGEYEIIAGILEPPAQA